MSSEKSLSSGLKYGLIAGLIYVIMLFLQYTFAPSNPLLFLLYKIITYVIIILVFLFAGLGRRKELGGYADFKTIFQTIFITIIITEIIYGIFSFIYLTYVDPQFFDNFMNNMMLWMQEKGMSQENIDKQLEAYKSKAVKPSIGSTALGICIWIVIDSIFGLIFAAIIKKQKPPFEGQ